MNGRALNEKAIEVSPSSNRVLERAHEILTPFPPSKNRPRPGDWTCPSCGFSNFQRRTACFRCSYPAIHAGPGPNEAMPYNPYGYPQPMMHHGPPPHLVDTRHSRVVSHTGGSAPFRPGDWKCGADGCGYHNFAKNVNCLRCGASRATAAIVGDTGYAPSMGDSAFGMGPSPMGGTPGPAPFGPGAFGAGPGFPGQQYGGPPSTYALPSGLGAGPSPYGTHMGPGFVPGNGMPAPGFDSRAEAAFSAAGPGQASSGGGLANGSFDGANDAFSFLSGGLGGLSLDDNRRNTTAGANKSPA